MSNYGSSSSSSYALTAAERAIAEYFADAECERKRPRNRDAYRATVLARKAAEIIQCRGIVTTYSEYHAPRPVVDVDPVDEFQPIDPLLVRQLVRNSLAEGREERRAELLTRMTAEQARDGSWHNR